MQERNRERNQERNQEKHRERNQKKSQNKKQSRNHSSGQVSKGVAKRKRHSRARKYEIQNKVAMKGIVVVVCLLLVVLLFHGRSLQDKVNENEVRLSQLQEAYEKEQERTKEIEDLQEYMQSDEYIEQYAKEKIGLLKENEILFKENK